MSNEHTNRDTTHFAIKCITPTPTDLPSVHDCGLGKTKKTKSSRLTLTEGLGFEAGQQLQVICAGVGVGKSQIK